MYQSATTAETTWERGAASGTHPRPPLPQSARVALAGSPHGPGAAHRNFPTPRRPDGVFGSREKREPGRGPLTHPPVCDAGAASPSTAPSHRPRGPGAATGAAPPRRPAATRRGRAWGGRGALAGGRCHSSSPPPSAALGRGLGARLAAAAACGRAGARRCF